MADVHQVIFYPVGNGDTTQIVLSKGRRVLFDFCHRDKAEDADTPEIDLKARLKEDLKAANRDYFDVVAFTHADLDHIQGSTEFFELQHAKKYHGDGRIKIRELWVPAAMLLEEADNDHQTEEYVLLRQEARHRLLEGKDILVFSKPQALADWLEPLLKARGESASARDHLFIDAGTIVPGFTLTKDGVEFFCHSPFIKHCDDGDIIRNSAALVFNVRFNADGSTYDYLEVGDAEYGDLEDIVSTTRYHKNDDRLAWDLFNIPHHCSYRALNEDKGKDETVPTPLVKDLLLMGKSDAYIVSCSKPIPDVKDSYEQVQPPHIQARKAYERYLKEVGGRKFLVTMEEPNANKPEPIIFEIGSAGVTWKRSATIGAPAILASRPPRAG
ncbi:MULTISPECIES: hypothetical protein [Pseudomonadota]|uniref:Beta-lactamase superfamily II metal-dependent hydrolase n=1 Tax=Fulvimonas soli TaxID=155197 RepID=A0A316I8Z8_9GAMM|nr:MULTISPECIES: hypothetical protein [Pseudomonadota]PRE10612.1 hypothetical protein C6P92_22775 [Burkholderia multivorans]PWK89697.1 hypothetical protein C7456_10445 [Fulvimonas soli]TNY27651.1 hypothetical protein BV497_03040 [Fulvimonas soli]